MNELCDQMGLERLNSRFHEPSLAPYFEGLFPVNNPKHSRYEDDEDDVDDDDIVIVIIVDVLAVVIVFIIRNLQLCHQLLHVDWSRRTD